MPLQTNALVTLAQGKAHLGIPTLDTTQDARVEDYINAASDHVESLTNRKLVLQTHTHYLDGNGKGRMLLQEFPAQKPTVVNMDLSWTFGSGTLVPTTEFEVQFDVILVRRSLQTFPNGARNVKVTYQAGYSTIPMDVQQATLLGVEMLYHGRNDRRLGVQSKTKVGESVVFVDAIPQLVQTLLAPYVREAYVTRQIARGGGL